MATPGNGSAGKAGKKGGARGNSSIRVSARNITRVKAPNFQYSGNRNSNMRAYGAASRGGARAKGGIAAAAKFQNSRTIAVKSAKGTSRSPNKSFQGIQTVRLKRTATRTRLTTPQRYGAGAKPITRKK